MQPVYQVNTRGELPAGAEARRPEVDAELEMLPEQHLTERARDGDTRAFGELVRRNRAKMVHVANSLTRDLHMAEDVVQEALVQAFLYVGKLVDDSRFAPWLARIVRNQAYMKLRRGGPYAKEQPFTRLVASEFGGTKIHMGLRQPSESSSSNEDWGDIDRVLFHLARRYGDEQAHDPVTALARKELVEGIRTLFACLSTREKDIFEAHFFHHVTPQEIAIALDTSVANVYNSISRARAKLQRERLSQQISLYVARRRDTGKPKRKLLPPPILYQPKEC